MFDEDCRDTDSERWRFHAVIDAPRESNGEPFAVDGSGDTTGTVLPIEAEIISPNQGAEAIESPTPGELVPTVQRGGDGRFVPGNAAALKHGRRSARAQEAMLPGQEAIRAEIEARVSEVLADLGGEGECSRLKRDAIRSEARLWVIEESLWADIERNGAMSTKGKRRASTTVLLNVIDRRMKLDALLGIERRPRQVGAELHDQVAAAERQRQGGNR